MWKTACVTQSLTVLPRTIGVAAMPSYLWHSAIAVGDGVELGAENHSTKRDWKGEDALA